MSVKITPTDYIQKLHKKIFVIFTNVLVEQAQKTLQTHKQ